MGRTKEVSVPVSGTRWKWKLAPGAYEVRDVHVELVPVAEGADEDSSFLILLNEFNEELEPHSDVAVGDSFVYDRMTFEVFHIRGGVAFGALTRRDGSSWGRDYPVDTLSTAWEKVTN